MIIKKIEYSTKFVKQIKKLDSGILKIAVKKERLFRLNPLHPSLRLHELKGKLKNTWSIYINGNYRIIFKRMQNGDIVFISIGKHDIYKYL